MSVSALLDVVKPRPTRRFSEDKSAVGKKWVLWPFFTWSSLISTKKVVGPSIIHFFVPKTLQSIRNESPEELMLLSFPMRIYRMLLGMRPFDSGYCRMEQTVPTCTVFEQRGTENRETYAVVFFEK